MIKTPEYQEFLTSLMNKGKMQIETKGVKRVDISQFASSFAEILLSENEFMQNLEGRDYPLYERRTLLRRLKSRIVETIDNSEYVTRDGKFLTRLEKRWNSYYNSNCRLPKSTFGTIGGIMRNFVTQSRLYTFDITDDFSWQDGMYGKEGSCWWNSWRDSIPTLQAAGGWAIRFYSDMNDTVGTGRTWILPKYGAMMFFNCYGIEPGDVTAIMSGLLHDHFQIDFVFRMIELRNSKGNGTPYINDGSGFILTTADRVKLLSPSKNSIELNMPHLALEFCGSCGKAFRNLRHDYNEFDCDGEGHGAICNYCLENSVATCDCGKQGLTKHMYRIRDIDKLVCRKCLTKYGRCDKCGGRFEHLSEVSHAQYCDRCLERVQRMTQSIDNASNRVNDLMAATSLVNSQIDEVMQIYWASLSGERMEIYRREENDPNG